MIKRLVLLSLLVITGQTLLGKYSITVKNDTNAKIKVNASSAVSNEDKYIEPNSQDSFYTDACIWEITIEDAHNLKRPPAKFELHYGDMEHCRSKMVTVRREDMYADERIVVVGALDPIVNDVQARVFGITTDPFAKNQHGGSDYRRIWVGDFPISSSNSNSRSGG